MSVCGHNTSSHDLLSVSLKRGGDPPSAEERFHRLSVLGTHAVVDEDVEGRVDVGGNLQKPSHHEIRVLVATSRVQFRYKGQHQPAWIQCKDTGMT